MYDKNDYSNPDDLISHIFRNESGKIVSTITRALGVHNIDLAEDLVQETILSALNYWKIKGIPPNPIGWLYKSAKNKAIDYIRRQKKLDEILRNENMTYAFHVDSYMENFFLDNEIKDSQLRMIFFCCNPSINFESQIALTLKIICGFSIKEIANAFFTNEESIQKRIYRAKQKLKNENISLEIPKKEFLKERLYIVNRIIYLLFNEGYNSSDIHSLIRKDLCNEAILLAQLISSEEILENADTYSILSLMFFQASRFNSRLNSNGEIILLDKQDRDLWDKNLIEKGLFYLKKALQDNSLTKYKLEASIASEHSLAKSFDETNWENILLFYDNLLLIEKSPIIELNRTIVIWKLFGAKKALLEINKIQNLELLDSYYLYHSTLGNLNLELENMLEAKNNFEKALSLTNSITEKNFLKNIIETNFL